VILLNDLVIAVVCQSEKKLTGVEWNNVSDGGGQQLGQQLRISHAKVLDKFLGHIAGIDRWAYYYRWSSVISLCLSVCLLVTFMSFSKMAEQIKMPFWWLTRVGPRNHLLDGGPDPPRRRGNIWGGCLAQRKAL